MRSKVKGMTQCHTSDGHFLPTGVQAAKLKTFSHTAIKNRRALAKAMAGETRAFLAEAVQDWTA